MLSATKVSDYCDLFLALTEQRTQTSLNESLMATCLILYPEYNFWLYDHQEINHQNYKLIHSSTPPQNFTPHQGTLDSTLPDEQHDKVRFSRHEDHSYYGFSILHSLSGFLITNMPHDDPLAHQVILKLTKVYANQRFFMFSALNDSLTGLSNRQAFDQQISSLLSDKSDGARRSSDNAEDNWCFAIMDIDHFKQVNDDYGHLFGDEVLLIFAQMMQQAFRDGDLLFRYGGEEFAVALRDISIESTMNVLDRFRKTVANAEFPQLGQVTVSIGVTQIEAGLSLPVLIDRADQALYFAKGHGRNQIHCFETLASSGHVQLNNMHEGDIELF